MSVCSNVGGKYSVSKVSHNPPPTSHSFLGRVEKKQLFRHTNIEKMESLIEKLKITFTIFHLSM